MNTSENVIIRKETLKRLIKDIREMTCYMQENGNIFYKHDTENIMVGYAMINGTEGTPYEYGYYFYKFDFPYDYPFSPPKVTYLTNDGITRFHPNFYKNGKCCLSILNTWKGDPWTSCQTILSVMLSLSSLFQNNPLLLEPGVTKENKELSKYNEIITYKNFSFSVLYILGVLIDNKEQELGDLYKCGLIFKDEVLKLFEKNKKIIFDKILEKQVCSKTEIIRTSIYRMEIKIDYISLGEKLKLKYNL